MQRQATALAEEAARSKAVDVEALTACVQSTEEVVRAVERRMATAADTAKVLADSHGGAVVVLEAVSRETAKLLTLCGTAKTSVSRAGGCPRVVVVTCPPVSDSRCS